MCRVHFHLHCTRWSAVVQIGDRGNSTSFRLEIRRRRVPLSRIVSLAQLPHRVPSSSTPSPRKHIHPYFDRPRMYLFPVRRRSLIIIFVPWLTLLLDTNGITISIDLTSCTSFVCSLHPSSQLTDLPFPQSGFQKIPTRIAA